MDIYLPCDGLQEAVQELTVRAKQLVRETEELTEVELLATHVAACQHIIGKISPVLPWLETRSPTWRWQTLPRTPGILTHRRDPRWRVENSEVMPGVRGRERRSTESLVVGGSRRFGWARSRHGREYQGRNPVPTTSRGSARKHQI